MNNELLYQIALTKIPNIGDVGIKALINFFKDAQNIFKASIKDLERVEGVGTIRANSIKHFNEFIQIENEIKFIESQNIKPLFLTDKDYPQRLLNCYDSPAMLYYKGNSNLNCSKIISIVGTRNHTDYGKQNCEKLIEEIAEQNILIISGLAFGIDTIAHKASLKNNLSTIAVLAHGLDIIYPNNNKNLSQLMLEQGGLLTEFCSKTLPDKQNFPKRNRIVAGMCDAIVVIESSQKGGSLITAELGNGYHKDVFAIPGRVSDSKSEGCNWLIKNNKAALITNGNDLLNMLNWKTKPKPKVNFQNKLFIDLTTDEKIIVEILKIKDGVQIDEIYFKSALSSSAVANALLMLEIQKIVQSLPGKVYRLVN